MRSSIDIAWLGGLLDGEGCFVSQTKGAPAIRLVMTDRDSVARAACILGSKVTGPHERDAPSDKPTWKPRYLTVVAGSLAAGWMMTLYQFVNGRRQEKIRQVLARWREQNVRSALRTHCPQGHLYSPENTYREASGARQCRLCRKSARQRATAVIAGDPAKRAAHLLARRTRYHADRQET
jgi:hypothetical protein